ncbi:MULTISPECIES: recombinase family protein [unclassified Saccharothrix]|uniref:recombinase family protein n=1 Tax=unclassified Saccharothrix TaxID=2593673 RepID=UPI00307F6EEB
MLRYIAANADRIDAVVVGEYERAFLDAGQVRAVQTVLEQYGVQLWLPEAEGPVDFDNPTHQALLGMLGKRSLTEVLRSRHRVVTAMRMQTVEQGRYLGGRPPYGYRLVDAGPHPNRALARRGVRQQRLVPDATTAPVVQLIFSLRLAGHSAAGIARRLNEQGVPSPSHATPDHNPHRVDPGWSLRTVTEILGNPRYTSHQVWNRTSADRATRSPSGRRTSVRNDQHARAISTRISHTPLVSEQDFVTAQTIRAARHSARSTAADPVHHLLAGRLSCGLCGRKMDSHRSHGRAAYRCRHGHTSARTRPDDAPRNLYLREDHLLTRIAAHLTAVGIADNPDPDQTVRLVDELDLAFRCDATTVTLLGRSTMTRARTPRRRPPPQPVHGVPGTGHRGQPGEQLLLALSGATASAADQPDATTGQVDAPTSRPRRPHQPLRRPIRTTASRRQHRQAAFHGALRTTRARQAEYPRPRTGEHLHDRDRQVVVRAGRRPLLLPAHRQTPYEQRSPGRLEVTLGNTTPHEHPR